MRPDQLARLQEIDEFLVEQFLLEADPRGWPGYGKAPADMTKDERGDAVWSKRGAVASAAVARSLHDLVDWHTTRMSKDPDTQSQRDDDLDKHINRYEREAEKLLSAVQAQSKR